MNLNKILNRNDRWENSQYFFYAQLLFRNVEIGLNNSVTDAGFPRGGDTNPPGEVGGAPTYDFTNFSQNMHEIEKIWTPRMARVPGIPVPSPLMLECQADILFGRPV